MRVRLHPKARAELRDARTWYHERSPLRAIAFAQTVENAISRIREAPNTFPLADHGTRKIILQRFPFNIFYETRLRSSASQSPTTSDGQAIGRSERCLKNQFVMECAESNRVSNLNGKGHLRVL